MSQSSALAQAAFMRRKLCCVPVCRYGWVLIAGVPGAFSAGNDLADFLTAAESTDGSHRPALRFLPALVRCNKPMVAAVSGVAVGIGTTMLFHCDFVVAGSDARGRRCGRLEGGA